MEQEKILKLLKEILELDNETLYDKENYSIFQMVERLEENNQTKGVTFLDKSKSKYQKGNDERNKTNSN